MSRPERKSSEDLIREANERLRGAQHEGDDPAESSDQSAARPPADSSPESPKLDYRSQRTHVDTSVPPAGPIEEESRRRSWNPQSLIRWALIALFLGGSYLFSTFGDADRGESGEVVDAGDLDVMSLQVGDCFNDPEGDDELVYDVSAVPCTEPHDNEVFAVQSVAAEFPGDTFPGQDPLWEYSYEVCSGPVFDSYVGTSYLDSSLDVFSFTPTQESWDDGDRGFVCALYRVDFAKLTGTVSGSGL
ncbi:MAG TPA: septum formation family protein [Acidimicrobiia bacterium]|nr:septum formation family protein [Acidimicrobiia bacterium]